MNPFRTFSVTVAAAGLFAALPAAAVVVTATYTGTVRDGRDFSGMYGPPDGDLTGLKFVATFTYDRALGANQSTDGITFDKSYGGAAYGTPGGSPVIVSTFTIKGVTKTIPGAIAGYAFTKTSQYMQHYSEYIFNDGVTYMGLVMNGLVAFAGAPASLNQNVAPLASSGGRGNFGWTVADHGNNVEYAYANFGPDVIYSVSGAVPEPASWTLMIAGFGMVGVARRRNWQQAAA